MPNSVLMSPPPQRPPLRLVQRSFLPAFREVGHGYRPGRSLGLSVAAHLMALVALFLAARIAALRPLVVVVRPRSEPLRTADVIYLPRLGGGSQGNGASGGGQGSAGAVSQGMRAQGRRGLAYPGPQPMVSDPPRALPGIQTILQPALPDPPTLHQVVKAPNIVLPPAPVVEAKLAAPAMVVRSGRVAIRRPVDASVVPPRIVLPVDTSSEVSALPKSKPPLPRRAIPEPVKASSIVGTPRDRKALLVLNAIPPPPDATGKIPIGEARSLFAVVPSDITVLDEPSAGNKAGGQASMAANGDRKDMARGDVLAEAPSGGARAESLSHGSGSGSGSRYGNGEGQGMSADGSGSSTGRGASSGSGFGATAAPGTGTGAGAGSAPGSGGFHGITIQGGTYGNGNNGSIVVAAPRPPKPYQMNIVSTANSGGGLPDLGFFHNEKVYTVFLDMRSDEFDSTPSWTLQYAVLQPEDEGTDAVKILGTPTPPYATLKDIPEFSSDVVKQCGREQIIMSAIMDTSGRLKQIAVLRSPAADVIAPLAEALQHWMFEPAKIDGRPVALKVLLGARVTASR